MKFARHAWFLVKDTAEGFIADDALSRGASIAYYTLFALAPVLLVVIAIAGLAFGHEAAQGAVVRELAGLMGSKTAEELQEMIESAARPREGALASAIAIVVLAIAISGVFGEVQSAMNAIWKARPSVRSTLSRLVRARIASLGLVVTAGFLLTVSLAMSAGLAAISDYLRIVYPAAQIVLNVADVAVSGALIAGLFAAMYKVLPDASIMWRDVAIGAGVTMLLFEGGKYAIALYVGQSNVASSYGAAGALIVLLVWIYYSTQIFLLGAEFTRSYSRRFGSRAARPA
jgi:membrane protein